MKKTTFYTLIIFILNGNLNAQYLETFSTPNKGYQLNFVDDFTAMNWTLSSWALQPPAEFGRDNADYYNTTAAGVLESIDLDQEVCWESPIINTVAANPVSLKMDLSWVGFDVDIAAGTCQGDYIRVYYSVNSGPYTMVPNVKGGNSCATVAYPFSGPAGPHNDNVMINVPGITGGSNLRIRVCVFTNANAEMVTIDNVNVPEVGVTVGCASPVLSKVITPVGCSNPNSGAIDLSVSAGTPGYSYSWSNGATSQDLVNIPVGSYTVTVTDAASCTATTSASVTNAPTLSLTTLVLNASCGGTDDGEIGLDVTGGVPGYTYDWSHDGPENPDNDSKDLIGVLAGSYTVTVTDASGCTATKNATIGFKAQVAYLEQFNIDNKGYLLNFVDDLAGIDWTLGPWSPQPPAAFGRDNEDYFRTSGGALVGVDFDQEICWTSPIVDLNTGTQFSVDLAWTGFDVQVDEYINVNYSINGGSFVTIPNLVGGGTGTIQYASGLDQNGSTTVTKTGLSGNTIQVQICGNFNANLETMTIDNVSIPNSKPYCPPPVPNLSKTDISCNGQTDGSITTTVSDGFPPYTFLWSNGAATQNLSGLGTGTYTVTVTDQNLLTGTAFITITQPSVLVLSASPLNVACHGGSNGSIDLSPSGGVPGYSYAWSNGATIQDISGLSAGTYTVTVTDANGCTKTNATTITQPSALVLSTNQVNLLCHGGSNGSIDLSPSGGVPGYSYSWSNGATTQDISGLSAGTYIVTVTDANGCTKTNATTITQPSALVLSTSQVNVSCHGGSNGSIDLSPSGGVPGYSYAWSNGATTQDISGLSAGTYTVTVTDANGCTKTNATTITQPSPINLTSTTTNPSNCFTADGSIDLTVSGGNSPYTYDWSNDGPENPDNDLQDLLNVPEGTYTVTVTDVNGCTNTHSKTLDYLDVVNPTVVCPVASLRNVEQGICVYTIQMEEFNATATDNCGISAAQMYTLTGATSGTNSGSLNGVQLNWGTTTVVWKATDESGNTNTCSFMINVIDTEDPNLICPPNLSVFTNPGECTAIVDLGYPTGISDNCGTPVVTNNAPGVFQLGNTNVKWKATDNSGNKNTCNQKVTVTPHSCGNPIQVYHIDTTETQAKIKWKDGLCATSFNLRIRQQIIPGVWGSWSAWDTYSGPSGPPTWTHQFTGLESNTFYNYQLRSKCGTANSTIVNGWFWTLPASSLPKNDISYSTIHPIDTRDGNDVVSIVMVPNPATNHTTILLSGFDHQNKKITMVDLYGRLIFNVIIPANQNQLELELKTLELRSGMYFIKVSDDINQKTNQLFINY